MITTALLVFAATTAGAVPPTQAVCTPAIHDDMRELWMEHVLYTHDFIVSDFNHLDDKDVVADNLMENQVEIGNALKPFFGVRAGDHITDLLQDHIAIAVELVDAVVAKRPLADIAVLQTRWNRNADGIARALSRLDPGAFEFRETRRMMRQHLQLTTQEVLARAAGDFVGELEVLDKIEAQALDMADMLSAGAVAHDRPPFPIVKR